MNFTLLKAIINDSYKRYYIFNLPIYSKFDFLSLERKIDRLHQYGRYIPAYILAQKIHNEVFPKYRNCNKGKDMVLLASGPTLDYFESIKNAVYLGVNDSFKAGKAELDYLFAQDYRKPQQELYDNYKGNNCRKFYGIHYYQIIAQSYADKVGAERYVFIDPYEAQPYWHFAPDISVLPLSACESVVHPAVQFALWTAPKRLYLVGCDSSKKGHSKALARSSSGLNLDRLIEDWKLLKKHAEELYPNTEIISVNPVGLKGLFHDVYTESYLAEHPEIDRSNIEILKVE